MGYSLIVLLPGTEPVSLPWLAERVTKRFASEPGVRVAVEATNLHSFEHLAVAWGEWEIRITKEEAETVLEESREIAGSIGSHRADRDRIAGCRRRFSLSSDDDPEMDRFNDYLFIVEILEKIPGAILIEDGEFMDES